MTPASLAVSRSPSSRSKSQLRLLRHEATLESVSQPGRGYLGRLKLLIEQGTQAIKLAGLAEIGSADDFIEGRAVGLIVDINENPALLILRFGGASSPSPSPSEASSRASASIS